MANDQQFPLAPKLHQVIKITFSKKLRLQGSPGNAVLQYDITGVRFAKKCDVCHQTSGKIEALN